MNKKNKKIDGLLVSKFQSGDKNAMKYLVKRWHQKFCKKAYWITKNADASKDIAQESWSTILTQLNNLKDPESFGFWASRIVYSKSIDSLNKMNKEKNELKQFSYNQSNVDVVEDESRDQLKGQILKKIKTLSENQQMIINLFYVEGYTIKQISNTLEISLGTVKSRLFHAREKLKQILKHRNYEK